MGKMNIKLILITGCNYDIYLTQRPHHIVREALEKGHSVLYVNPGESRSFKIENFEQWNINKYNVFFHFTKILEKIGNRFLNYSSIKILFNVINILKRKTIYDMFNGADELNILFAWISHQIIKLKFKNFMDKNTENVILFEQPFDIVRLIPYFKKIGYKIIYDMIDDWSAFETSPHYFSQSEDYLLIKADGVMSTSKLLYNKAITKNKNVILVPNGVQIEHFKLARYEQIRPIDMPKGKLIIGYYGIMREWFDEDLVKFLADNLNNCILYLIGSYSNEVYDKLKNTENIYFANEKNYDLLPQYLHYFDVTIIPFKKNKLINSTNPIKVYEYLGGGKPVVATFLPELINMPYVSVSESYDDFLKNIEKALTNKIDISLIDNYLADKTWNNRFNKIEIFIRSSEQNA